MYIFTTTEMYPGCFSLQNKNGTRRRPQICSQAAPASQTSFLDATGASGGPAPACPARLCRSKTAPTGRAGYTGARNQQETNRAAPKLTASLTSSELGR